MTRLIPFALVAVLFAQEQRPFAPANNVSFTVSTARNDYAASDLIVVRYQIANIGTQPIYVPKSFRETACLDMNHAPHIWAWFENSAGKDFTPGYGVSCGGTPGAPPPTIAQRMNRNAVLLHPGEHLDDMLELKPSMFSLPPGAYRIQATLTGWDSNKFSEAERAELGRMGNPFLEGEVPASLSVNLR